jgi:hypothetical protein
LFPLFWKMYTILSCFNYYLGHMVSGISLWSKLCETISEPRKTPLKKPNSLAQVSGWQLEPWVDLSIKEPFSSTLSIWPHACCSMISCLNQYVL